MKISKCSFSFRPEGVHMCVFVCVVIVVCVSCAYVCTLVCVYIIMCVWLCVCVCTFSCTHFFRFMYLTLACYGSSNALIFHGASRLQSSCLLSSLPLIQKKSVNKCLGIDRISFHRSVLIIFVLVWEDFEQKWSSTEITGQYEVKTWDLLILTPALP